MISISSAEIKIEIDNARFRPSKSACHARGMHKMKTEIG
jgi:hypothetical protein